VSAALAGRQEAPAVPIRPSLPPALAALALATLCASGCGPAHDALAVAAPAADAGAAPERTVEAIGWDEDALPLPADFPDDVYLPPHYRIDSVMDRGGLRVLSLQAPGRVSALFGDASQAMREHGWKQTLAMRESGGSAVLTYEKDERAAVMSFNGGGGTPGVTMSVQLRNNAP
jgi:hypothetical protein